MVVGGAEGPHATGPVARVGEVLQRCGLTAEQLGEAGFSPAEITRLQNALWVYSQVRPSLSPCPSPKPKPNPNSKPQPAQASP